MTFKERDRWMRRVLGDNRMSLAQRAIAVRVALFLRVEDGSLPFKWACLTAALGDCSQTTVQVTMSGLVALGYLKVTKGKRYEPNTYELLFPTPSNGLHEMESPTPPDGADPTPPDGVKILSEEAKRSSGIVSGADAPGVFRQEIEVHSISLEAESEDDEVAYRSSDGLIEVTAKAVGKLCKQFPMLAEDPDFDLIGYIRNIDTAKIASGAAMLERRTTIMRKLKYSNDLRIKRMTEGKQLEEEKKKMKARAERRAREKAEEESGASW